MRGNALFVAVFMLAIIVAFAGAYGIRFNLFGGGEETVHKTTLQSDLYAMDHALDAARLYLRTSLNYAVYQACYDRLKWMNISGSERSGLPDISEDEFYKGMESLIETYMNRYTEKSYSFLSGYRVVLPAYDISVSHEQDSFSVRAIPHNMMYTTSLVKSGESITLSENAELYSEYNIPCAEIYAKARETNPSLKADFEEAFITALQNITPDKCSDDESCSRLLEETLESSHKTTFNINNGEYEITSELQSASVRVQSIDLDTGNITYTASATQRITVAKGDSPHYPVWDGNDISFDRMRLVYVNTVAS